MTQGKNSSGETAKSAVKSKASSRRLRPKVNGHDRPLNPASQSLVGVFVFALGLAAIIAVGYLAFVKLNSSAPTTQTTAGAHNLSAQNPASVNATAQPDAATDVKSLKLDKADRSAMNGQWVAQNAGRTAYLTIAADDQYQIMLYMDSEGYERRYANGRINYDAEQGIVTLNASYDPLPEIDGAVVKSLTRRVYTVVPLQETQTGALYWVSPNNDNARAPVHPVFSFLERSDSFLVWSRLK